MAKRRVSTVTVVPYGPGWYRMRDRIGPKAMEAMRQDVLARQREARAKVSGEKPEELRDRSNYKEYPPPKAKSKRHK